MTDDKIAEIARHTMGCFVGRLINDDLFREIVERMSDDTGCEVRCDAELNPLEQTLDGVVRAAVTVPSGCLMVTLESVGILKGNA